MTARNTKLNGAELLERLGVPVLAEAAPRVVRRVPFVSMEGNGSGKVSTSAEGVREYLADLGNPEQDRAAMLRRVNTRGPGHLPQKGAGALVLTWKQLGTGKGFRVWRSARRPRAVPSWETGDRFPIFSRFRSIPGVFPLAVDLPKLGKVNAEGENRSAAYLEQLGAATRNRVRSSSPRWRGTARHKAERTRTRAMLCTYYRLPRASFPQSPKRTSRNFYGDMSPAAFIESYLTCYEAAVKGRYFKALESLRKSFRRYVASVRVDLRKLRELLRLLREAQAAADTYAGYIGLLHAEVFRVFLLELSAKRQEPEQLPRPPDLLPLPPAAPLAPPA